MNRLKILIVFLFNSYLFIINVYYLSTDLFNKIIRSKERKKNLNLINYKKIIKINCIDLYEGQNIARWLEKTLGKIFLFEFNTNYPDYIIYNIFGSNHLKEKYKTCIKIAYFTENKIPDLNIADYSIGFFHINYLDRYIRLPNFLKNNSFYTEIREKVLKQPKRSKFCAAAISNGNGYFRNLFIQELNKYKTVEMGGKFNNNINRTIDNKINFFENYKFSIAMENSEGDGYTSEKM